ncbi:MAG: hypothetical protein CFK52_12875, partial [Chloracidobacterium sp. CP2_5A]
MKNSPLAGASGALRTKLRFTDEPFEILCRQIGTSGKMAEQLANGARLGWLIGPEAQVVYIYRLASEVVALEQPTASAGDPEGPGLVLDLAEIRRLLLKA